MCDGRQLTIAPSAAVPELATEAGQPRLGRVSGSGASAVVAVVAVAVAVAVSRRRKGSRCMSHAVCRVATRDRLPSCAPSPPHPVSRCWVLTNDGDPRRIAIFQPQGFQPPGVAIFDSTQPAGKRTDPRAGTPTRTAPQTAVIIIVSSLLLLPPTAQLVKVAKGPGKGVGKEEEEGSSAAQQSLLGTRFQRRMGGWMDGWMDDG